MASATRTHGGRDVNKKPLFVSALQLGITDRNIIFDLLIDEDKVKDMSIEERSAYFKSLDEEEQVAETEESSIVGEV